MTDRMIDAARHAVEAIEADGFGVMAGLPSNPAALYFREPDSPAREDDDGLDSLMRLRLRMNTDPEFNGAVPSSISSSTTSLLSTTSAAGSRPSRGSRPTSSSANSGQKNLNASGTIRSIKCRD